MTSATIALVGNPNAGKSSLFNALTGSNQKVANYPGVTVESRLGRVDLPGGGVAEIIDLPGAYSLDPRSPDEAVTRNVIAGAQAGAVRPDVLICVVDATNLANHLRFVLELKAQGLPMLVALNMMDLAQRDGLNLELDALAALLGIPVIPTVAVRRRGIHELVAAAEVARHQAPRTATTPAPVQQLAREARHIARQVTSGISMRTSATRVIDAVVLHPVAGPLILAVLLFFIFQSVFAWAEAPMGWIESGIGWLQAQLAGQLPEGWVSSLVIDGVLAGVGSVIVFLPQIVILFLFILLLEQSGYMTRAAFLMDRLMASVGLNGRAFIPLLSAFACAIPGIMAARTIDNPRDRLTTILIAPLMTCSARLPVYAVIIAAFIPAQEVGPGIGLQGLVLFILYLAGIVSALAVAAVLKRTLTRGAPQPLLMEMPKYQWPPLRDIAIGLWQRAAMFLKRAGTIIMAVTIVLWALSSYPKPPEGADRPALDYSFAGRIGAALEVIVAPIGFNREIAISLLPAMAAREVAVSALATVYALEGDDSAVEASLVERLRGGWGLPTALAFLAWFVFAPQCLSTLAVTRRETNSWRWPIIQFSYLFALAYVAAGVTYWTARTLLG